MTELTLETVVRLEALKRKIADCANSPWPGVTYQYAIRGDIAADGITIERPQFMCQPPGKPVIKWPEK